MHVDFHRQHIYVDSDRMQHIDQFIYALLSLYRSAFLQLSIYIATQTFIADFYISHLLQLQNLQKQ